MNSDQNHKYLQLIKRSLLAIEKLELQVKELEASRRVPIAVIGAACRFPGEVENTEDYWHLLTEKKDAIIPLPDKRWDMESVYDADQNAPGKIYNNKGGFLKNVDKFDAAFFNISPIEAITMDPQQRLALQTSWHALEDAGIAPESIKESQTGVFLGIGQNDYAYLLSQPAGMNKINPYFGMGNGHCFAPGRISYVLGLHGPSMSIDTACSSSLLATHLACQSLREGECGLALAGGVQLMLSPLVSVYLSRTRALSPSNRCHAFSNDADGFVRSEGVGIIVLKRLDDAIKAGDRILAVIKGSSINHDGSSSGLTVPNGLAQQRLLQEAIKAAGVKAEAVQFIEAHGTGTILGDPIELEALGMVYGNNRKPDSPLWVGSVKSNIGHLEAAAGIASLIKTSLVLQHKIIPPNLNFNTPNPKFDWSLYPLRVPVEPVSVSVENQPFLAAVSSFGLSGSNVHIIMEESPHMDDSARKNLPYHVFTISAKSSELLLSQIREVFQYIKNHPEEEVADMTFTANVGRQHYSHRIAFVIKNKEALLNELEKLNTVEALKQFQHQLKLLSPGPQIENFVEECLPFLYWAERVGEQHIQQCFQDLCALYVKNKKIDWKKLYVECNYRKVSFPFTRFEQRRYWLDMLTHPTNANSTSSEKLSPNPIHRYSTEIVKDANGESHLRSDPSNFPNVTAKDTPVDNIIARLHGFSALQAQKELVHYLQQKIAVLLAYTDRQLPDAKQGFFEMGIDSITAVQLKEQVEQQLHIQLPAAVIFEFHTIEQLSTYLLKIIKDPKEQKEISKPAISNTKLPPVSNPLVMHLLHERGRDLSNVDSLIKQLENQIETAQQYEE